MAQFCYPSTTDWTCLPEGTTLDPEEKDRAEAFAWAALRALTGAQTGNCPFTLRPCAARCNPRQTWRTAPVGTGFYNGDGFFSPYMENGALFNGCGCGDECNCGGSLSIIYLPGPVAEVREVKVDGAVLPPSAYRLYNGNELVRIDGERWPGCQDIAEPDTEVGTFSVSMVQGYPVDQVINVAAGVLAYEFYLGCHGKACRLPSNVTSISRQGVDIELAGGMFAEHYIGIPEVDVVIAMLNPYGLKMPPAFWSPDMNRSRYVG